MKNNRKISVEHNHMLPFIAAVPVAVSAQENTNTSTKMYLKNYI